MLTYYFGPCSMIYCQQLVPRLLSQDTCKELWVSQRALHPYVRILNPKIP